MISIILPSYNSIAFLKERVDTIINQTFQDWECIVIDGNSKDGTWEYMQAIAEINPKFHLYQFPPQGPYDAWNKGIEEAKGKYIYIATADDTMTVNCLEVMQDALEENMACGIAHCNLTLIDESSRPTTDQWSNWGVANFLGEYVDENHIREKPYDAVMYMIYKTAYTSITQLLVRREVYKNFGNFRLDFGNIADFEWGFRITQCTNTIHIPQYLATWRQHSGQLSESSYFKTGDYFNNLLKMVHTSSKTLKNLKIKSVCLTNPNLYIPYLKEILRKGTLFQRLKWFIRKPLLSVKIVYQYISKESFSSSDFLNQQLVEMNLKKNLFNI